MKKHRYYILYALLIAAALFVHLHRDISVPANRPLEEIPRRQGGWRMAAETRFNQEVLDVLRPTDYLVRNYIDGEGNRVGFYLGYHGGGPESGPIHSPKHCLPGSGWQEVSSKKGEIEVEGRNLQVVNAVYQNGYRKELFLYWFQVQGKTLANEYALKLAEVTNSIFRNRRDAAFIRISVPFEGDPEQPRRLAERFVQDYYPYIDEVLPR